MADFIPLSIDGNPHIYIQASMIVSLTAGYAPSPLEPVEGEEDTGVDAVEFSSIPGSDDVFTLSIALADGQTYDLRGSVAEVTYDLLTGNQPPPRGDI